MKTILQNIQDKIAQIPDFKYIDEDWGQLQYYQPPVKWPCCLIGIGSASYSNLGKDLLKKPQNRQLAKISATLTVATLKLSNTSHNAPQTQKEQAWAIWEMLQKVHETLHGFSPSQTSSKMLRNSLLRTQRDDGVQEYQMVYDFEVNSI